MFENMTGKLSKDIANCVARFSHYYYYEKIGMGSSEFSLAASLYSLLPDVQEKSISIGPFKASISYNSIYQEVLQILSDEIVDLSKLFSEGEINLLLEHFQELVEYCLNVFNSGVSIRHRGQCTQPNQLTRLCLEIAAFKKGDCIYNPFTGLASYPILNRDCYYEGDEKSSYTWALSQINLLAHNSNAHIRCGDAFETLESKDKYYDGIIMSPPFALRERNCTEIDAVRLAIENKLKVGGKLVVVLPMSILFSTSNNCVELRRYLLGEHYINMVVTLPNILFIPYAGVNTCILSISKSKNDSCLLVDGTSFIGKEKGSIRDVLQVDQLLASIKQENSRNCVRVKFEKLLEKGNLIPNAYLPFEFATNYPTKKLGELIYVYKSVKDGSQSIDMPIKLIDTKALSFNDIDKIINIDDLNYAKPKNQHNIVESNSVLLFPTEKGMRFSRIGEIPSNVVVSCSPHIHTARVLNVVTVDFLLLQLASDFVKEQISRLFISASHGVLPYRFFINIEIPVPPLEVQAKMLQEYYQTNMSEKEKTLETSIKKYKTQIHLRKHAMTQNLSALSALWNTLNIFRTTKNGVISDKDIVSKVNQMTVGELFDVITHRIDVLSVQTDNLANIEYNWGDSSVIVPSIFIHNYIEQHKDVRFMFVEGNIINLMKLEKVNGILFPAKAMDRVFDNIVSNAISYGFNDSSRLDYKIFFEEIIEDVDSYKVRISNNGSPIPGDMNVEDVFAFGYSSALNEVDENGHEHMGLGAFEVRNILEDNGASVRLISTPENEYTVTYEITFTKTNLKDE